MNTDNNNLDFFFCDRIYTRATESLRLLAVHETREIQTDLDKLQSYIVQGPHNFKQGQKVVIMKDYTVNQYQYGAPEAIPINNSDPNAPTFPPESKTEMPGDMDNAYPTKDVLSNLVWAAKYLLNYKSYDGPNYEEIEISVKRAEEIIQSLSLPAQGEDKDWGVIFDKEANVTVNMFAPGKKFLSRAGFITLAQKHFK